jgi:DNA repair protein RecN (Recombination protein N)
MLKRLAIEQFVIIDKLAIDFKPGLTIVTGETGAGKSILLDAMGLILGDASDPESIRSGSQESVIEALFTPPATHPVWSFLVENNLANNAGGEFQIYRLIKRNGNDDNRVNGKPVDLDLLKKLGAYLVEIHGQFANQSITDPANQLKWLDLSGAFPPEVFKNVVDALHDVRRYTKELEDENVFLARHKGRELARIENLYGRFEKIGMKQGFIDEVKTEYAKLLRAKETSEAFQTILAQLISGNGVVSALSTANRTLAAQKNVDREKVAELSRLLAEALDDCRASVLEIGRISPEYDIDTGPLHRYQEILAVLDKIGMETKTPFEGLAALYDDIFGRIRRVRLGRETIARLQEGLIKAKNAYRHHAHILSEKRVEAGKALSKAITAELPPLKLMKAEFDVSVVENVNMEWTELGLNEVTYTARMNPGMPFSAISQTASGGEMARLILALKVVLQRVQTTPTLVFDEVDTGIGGAAAAAVGERLALLAENTQVLVITHSPQVASRGDQHLHVSKKTDGVTTTSAVRFLTMDERIDEVSRMLAGEVITTEASAAAKSLINEAQTAAAARRDAGSSQSPAQ